MVTAYKEKIENYIKNIKDTIIAAERNHDIWWIYKNKDTRPKFIDVMNRYLAFFRTSIHAHFVAIIIAMYRLYETRRDTISLSQLLRLLDKSLVGFHKSFDIVRQRVNLLRIIGVGFMVNGGFPLF